ncbi:hypothetical protein HU200_003118 [Digitaria exilis]|uniref:Photosystem I reaction center subunit II, chloroplastic n=1 Tax=Digitaria exilis TaxID=1010633 RepID=A0A835FX18_9POAL|nr:hypothetical protein HU200_003513 [Digitaria exilis]KAF8779012.1 hypothetical protein HU200_003118 [Digitaria exilis]
MPSLPTYQNPCAPLAELISPYPLLHPLSPPKPQRRLLAAAAPPPRHSTPPLSIPPTSLLHPRFAPRSPRPPPPMAMATQASAAIRHLLAAPANKAPRSPSQLALPSSSRGPAPLRAAAEEATAEAPKGFVPPQLDPNTPSPIFGGSTGGLLRKAQVEEFYVITWTSPKEQVFEMPTGGAAIMREGPNLLKLARKEQCLALGTRLRSKYKINYQFYRVFPNGEVQYLHPKDGVYPEKVNAGRQGVGQNFRSIGKNVSPIEVKFTGKNTFDL